MAKKTASSYGQTQQSRSLFVCPYKIDAHMHTLQANPTKEYIEREAYRIKKTADAASARGLDAIVLTDFGHIEGFNVLYHNIKVNNKWLFDDNYELKREESSVTVRARNYDKDLMVFLGEEIPTKQGEVLGCFIRDYIQPNKDINETIREIDNQGGVVIFPHPLAKFFGGVGKDELAKQCSEKGYIKAIEVFNGQLAWPTSLLYESKELENLASGMNEVKFGNSDARGYMREQYNRAGSVYTELVGLNEISKEAIREHIRKKGRTRIKGSHNSFPLVALMMLPTVTKSIAEKIKKKING